MSNSMIATSSGINEIANNSKKKTFSEMVASGLMKSISIERNGRLWVSQVGSCARKGALKAIEHKQDVEEASTYAYYKLGNTIEDIVLTGITNDGYMIKPDVKLPAIRGLNMGGYIDAVAIQMGKVFCLEVKSAGNFAPTSPVSTFKSYYTHKGQVLLYAAITGLDASLLYFSRNPAGYNGWLNIKQFEFYHNVEADKKQIHQALFNAVHARECLKKGILPSTSPELTNKSRCGFCDYKNQCWLGEPFIQLNESPDAWLKAFEKAYYKTEKLVAEMPERREKFLARLRRKRSVDEQFKRYGL